MREIRAAPMSDPSGSSNSKKLLIRAVTASGLAMGVSLAMSVVVSRILGAEARGQLAAMQLWPIVLGGLTTLGLPSASAFYLRKREALQATIYTVGLCVVFMVSLGSAAVMWPILGFLLPNLSTTALGSAQVFLIFGLPITAISIYLGGCGQATADMTIFNISKVLPVLLQVPAVVAVLALGVITAERIAFGYLIGQFLVVVLLLVLAGRSFGMSLRRMRLISGAMLGYGVGVWGSEVLGTITVNADKMAISHWLTLRELGIYSVAYSISRAASHIPNSIAAIIFPRNVGREATEVVESIFRAFRLSFWPVFAVAVPLSVFIYPIFGLMFGKDFAIAGLIFPILLAECLVGASSWILAQAFNALGKPGLVVVRQIAGLAAFGVLAVALMPYWGITGAAFATLGASATRLIATVASFRSGLGIQPPRFMWSGNDWRDLRILMNQFFRR